MHRRSLMHLSRKALLNLLNEAVATERGATADLLHVLAEVDRRRLWAEAGYPSLYRYCVGALGFVEDAAFKRMRAARLVRRFPMILDMVADGRLHLSALVLLHPHLMSWNAEELLAAAARKTTREIRLMLAERFPRGDVATLVTPLAQPAEFRQLAPEPVGGPGIEGRDAGPRPVHERPALPVAAAFELAPEPVGNPATACDGACVEPAHAQSVPPITPAELAPEPGDVPVSGLPRRPIASAPYPTATPLAPERYAVQFTMSQEMHDKLRHAQELLSHQMPGAEIPAVLERALDALIAKLEQTRFAATARPRRAAASRPSADPRHIPAHVQRTVWKRDDGSCTWVAEDGRRCGSRAGVEFHHVDPVGKGGGPTPGNVRLLCRAHNQLEAEREFGEGFMHRTRERAQSATERRPARAPTAPRDHARAREPYAQGP